ncbi:hypothetical protein ACFLVG_03205 [Chloroflexota bacterium]
MAIEGCPLQHQKEGDCRICPQGEGCIFLILLKKLDKIEDRLRGLSK